MRCFDSKAAALVLVWSQCSCISLWSIAAMLHPVYSGLRLNHNSLFATVSCIPVVVLVISIPLSGWLADSRFGNFKVFKAGAILMFVGNVLVSVCTLAVLNQPAEKSQGSLIISATLGPFSNFISFVGGGACLVTMFQLGLDQMPDASSQNIMSYIAWYCTTLFFGFWTSNMVCEILTNCIDYTITTQIVGIHPVLCMCVVLVSLFIFSGKWLIIEPQSSHSLKSIFNILKFAAKHKSPINRSALTYWEEKIPSRIDLAKSRYGGPFTLEQVEDVKIILRLLVAFIPIWITAFGISVYGSLYLLTNPLDIPELENFSTCTNHVVSKFTYNPWWCSGVTVLFFEVGVTPCFGNRFHLSILKKLGLLLFVLALLSIAYSVIGLLHADTELSVWAFAVYSILSNSSIALVIEGAIEFVCAQSPYSMRGLMSGFVTFTIITFLFFGHALSWAFTQACFSRYCAISQYSIGAMLSIVGFLLHIVVIRWYKHRVRDEEYNLHHQVEQTYAKYVSHNRSI